MKSRSPYLVPALHVFVWLLLLSIPAILLRGTKFEAGDLANFFFISNLYHIGLFYFAAYYLYPKFVNRRWWWIYILAILALIIFSYNAKVFILELFYPAEAIWPKRQIVFFPPIPFLIAATVFRFVLNRIRFEKQEKERKAERLASELKFLRSQVSPHFLFNVLTNMVSLARQKSDLLEPTLIRLADLLRYMLYETNGDRFSITQEVSCLQSYIELQRLRFGEDVQLQVDIKIDNASVTIEPMLLIPFVENAFKHGVGLLKQPYIKVFLELQNAHLDFTVTNNYNSANLSKDKNSGIGLSNVRNRLDLLYPQKYRLNMYDNGEIYMAELKLDLS